LIGCGSILSIPDREPDPHLVCVAGACECAKGFANCDGDEKTGCESACPACVTGQAASCIGKSCQCSGAGGSAGESSGGSAGASATCSDKTKNGTETDIDCGGDTCGPCGPLRACEKDLECATGTCTGNQCVPTPVYTWVDISGTDKVNPPRVGFALVHDVAAKKTVLFGGLDPVKQPNFYYQDTWIWASTGFALLQPPPATKPSERSSSAIVYRKTDNKVVLVGGFGQTVYGDTWTFDGNNWTDTGESLEPHYGTGSAYDEVRGAIVLFSGVGTNHMPLGAETWELADGTPWTKKTSLPQSPSARTAAGMAYDADLGVIVLYGGHSNPGAQALGDTWTYEGTTWTEVNPAADANNLPSPMMYPALAYDPRRHAVILYTEVDRVTWEFRKSGNQTGQWIKVATGSGISTGASLAFDTTLGATIATDGQQMFKYQVLAIPCKSDGICAGSFCVEGLCCEAKACGAAESCATAESPGHCKALGQP
jgi:hypothetical protein